MTTQLNQANLASLPANVKAPSYDRSALRAGILHIGIGNFHRSHQAMYLQKLFEQGKDHDWALIGCGVKSFDVAMRDKLAGQDWLTTVVELDKDALSAEVCGSMIDFLNIDADEVIAALCKPEIRIVSLTITEGGYFIDAKTGGFQQDHPDIQADVADASPVFCEPFRQWVIEDNFPQGRPALEDVGVEFVEDVTAHEFMKLRILNGGHAALAFPSALLSLFYVHEGMQHPLVRDYVRKLVTSEAIPTLSPVPGTDFNDYVDLIEARFANPEIGDTISRLCTDSSNRLPKFILPITQANLDSNGSVTGTALVIALWCRYCAFTADESNNTVLNDEQAPRLQKLALEAKTNPASFLAMDDVFGQLGQNPRFAEAFSFWLQKLWETGAADTLTAYINGDSE